MAGIPVRFKRVAEAFEMGAKIRVCESSGSEHSPESPTDLSDLVNSFIEKNGFVENEMELGFENEGNVDDEFGDGYGSDSEAKDLLKGFLKFDLNDYDKMKVYREAERAYRLTGDPSAKDFKRRFMTQLRDNGLDAGLCKSKWEKVSGSPSGDYEYVDVNIGKSRYIIEVMIASEFRIARPTDRYTSLLDNLPQILVTKTDELKKIIRLICRAMKKSMKRTEMHLPPWRKYRYVEAKWFSGYKRTTNQVSTKMLSHSGENLPEKVRSVGFLPIPVMTSYCREDFAVKRGSRTGNLAALLL